MPVIDLNCDLGEAFGNYSMPNDEALMDFISSVNIACGFHAGDPSTMEETVHRAMKKGLALGAHPGLPDLQGFGRREWKISPKEVYQISLYQIGALSAFVKSKKGHLSHVKAHGALYNMASRDKSLAKAFVEAVFDFDPGLKIYALAGGEMIRAARDKGMVPVSEVFADRIYEKDGSLRSRSLEKSMITDPEQSLNQVMNLVKNHEAKSLEGESVPVMAETICIHGDGEKALFMAEKIYKFLIQEGITIKAPGK
jgi:UPF0271 protein